MAASNFDRCLPLVLKHEGGYVNHPRDPGGATNRGITQATYDAFRRDAGKAKASVRLITDYEVAQIYRERYWRAVHCDALPAGVDYATFDFGVNSGPKRAAMALQRAVGVADDGVIGPITLKAVASADPVKLVSRICTDRLAFLRRLSTYSTFGKGWERRVAEVEAEGRKMAAAPAPRPVPVLVAGEDADEPRKPIPVPQPPKPASEPVRGLWAWLRSWFG